MTWLALRLVSASVLLSSCGGGGSGDATPTPTPTPASSQRLAMSINTPHSSVPFSIAALDSAVALAQGAGVHGVIATYTWRELELTPGQIDVSSLQAGLSYYHQKGLGILLGIQVINTVKREVPTDLESTAFDDPVFIGRFHALMDAVRSALSGSEIYVSIGNEVDVYLDNQPTEWAPYTAFYGDTVAYLHTSLPGLPVGVTTTFGGYSSDSTSLIQTLNRQSDVIILTYYPLQAAAQVLPPNAPATDLPRMLSLAGNKSVVLQEAGYPSGILNGSSASDQQQFVVSLLQAWHDAGNRLPFLSYFLLYDFDATTCSNLGTFYGSQDPAFLSYLCTLGLRNSDGTPKPA